MWSHFVNLIMQLTIFFQDENAYPKKLGKPDIWQIWAPTQNLNTRLPAALGKIFAENFKHFIKGTKEVQPIYRRKLVSWETYVLSQ